MIDRVVSMIVQLGDAVCNQYLRSLTTADPRLRGRNPARRENPGVGAMTDVAQMRHPAPVSACAQTHCRGRRGRLYIKDNTK